ncbi:hypothetical protein [Mycoplasma leonicaptivi]|uniref:hypothetical protein n=1 Tax=Mycoplasma leonicaptivi TaxID=36742 RepID=UPI000488A8D6|nr:hypothetical protein [Mycoplasma leonicaptivi]
MFIPQNFIWVSSERQNNFETEDTFAYEELTKQKINELNFDSEAELAFAKKIKDYLEYNDINVWSKNPVPNGLGFEYINDDFEVRCSYPDFIVKKDNHFIYFEVKTYQNDIDINKTKKLFDEYKKYIENLQEDSFDLSLIICLVENSNETKFKYGGWSTIKKIDQKLKDIDTNNSHIHDQIISKSVISLKDILNIK